MWKEPSGFKKLDNMLENLPRRFNAVPKQPVYLCSR
jgi:hypothetical protein